ncbi:MAG: hypothetical protein AAF921_07145 [Cyanobacteria bacterium P01_D01_bin.44]
MVAVDTALLLLKTFMKKPWLSLSVAATSLMWVGKPAVSAELCTDTLPTFEVTDPSGDLFSEAAHPEIWAPPTSLDAELTQLERLIAGQGYESAKQWLARQLPIQNQARLLYRLGSLTWNREDYAVARQLWQDSLALVRRAEPSQAREDLLFTMAVWFRHQELLPLAVEAVWAMADETAQLEHLHDLLIVYHQTFDRATVRQFQNEIYTYLGSRPSYRALLLSRVGVRSAELDQPIQAIDWFDRAMEVMSTITPDPLQAETREQTVLSLIQAVQLDQALNLTQQLPDPTYWQFQVAIALVNAGRHQEAIDLAMTYENRGQFSYLQDLSAALAKAGQLNCALQVALPAEIDGGHLEAQLPTLTLALVNHQRSADALALLEKSIQGRSDWFATRILTTIVPQWLAQGHTQAVLELRSVFFTPEAQMLLVGHSIEALAAAGDIEAARQLLPEAQRLAQVIESGNFQPVPPFPEIPPQISSLSFPPFPEETAPSDPAIVTQNDQYRRQIAAGLPLAAIHTLLRQPQAALANLQTALTLSLEMQPQADISTEHKVALTREISDQYLALGYETQLRDHLRQAQQTVMALPAGPHRESSLESLANGFATVGDFASALALAEPQQFSREGQTQLAVALAQAGEIDRAITLADAQRKDLFDDAELLALIASELFFVGAQGQADAVLEMALHRWSSELETESAPNTRYFQQESRKQMVKRLVQRGWYAGALRILQTPNFPSALTADFTDLRWPLAELSLMLLDLSEIAIAKGDYAASLDIVGIHPNPQERARILAQLSRQLHSAGQPTLAETAWQSAVEVAETMPDHWGKAMLLLEIIETADILGRKDEGRMLLTNLETIAR